MTPKPTQTDRERWEAETGIDVMPAVSKRDCRDVIATLRAHEEALLVKADACRWRPWRWRWPSERRKHKKLIQKAYDCALRAEGAGLILWRAQDVVCRGLVSGGGSRRPRDVSASDRERV